MKSWTDGPVTVHVGGALDVLRQMPSESMHCCVTSPPYWGLRDYGVEPAVWGGDPACEHCWGAEVPQESRHRWTSENSGAKQSAHQAGAGTPAGRGAFCLCGAWRGSLGLEPTPELYVAHLTEVFCEVWRVLRQDGTCWLNLGDSYASSGTPAKHAGLAVWSALHARGGAHKQELSGGLSRTVPGGLKPKDLVMIPARVALALQAAGWWLRSDVIWVKPNPMPESVTDRPTMSHEHVYLLTRSSRYFYDSDAVRESPSMRPQRRFTNGRLHDDGRPQHRRPPGMTAPISRNLRSVWTMATQPYAEAHFATFPDELAVDNG